MLVAFCAGCGNVVITTPIWVVATRMQAEQKRSKDHTQSTPLKVAQEVYEESGIRASGLCNLIVLEVLYALAETLHKTNDKTFLQEGSLYRSKKSP